MNRSAMTFRELFTAQTGKPFTPDREKTVKEIIFSLLKPTTKERLNELTKQPTASPLRHPPGDAL